MRRLLGLTLGAAYSIAIASAVLGSSAALAADIFVDAVNGNDGSGDGSSGNPYKTIGHGLSQASAGDTVRVRPGVYDEDGNGESFPLHMVPGVALVGESTDDVLVAPYGSTAIELENGSFGPDTRIEGLTIWSLSDPAYSFTSGIEMRGASGTGYARAAGDGLGYEMSPVVENNVIGNFAQGILLHTPYGYPVHAAPVISNNVVSLNRYGSLDLVAAAGATVDARVSNNLFEVEDFPGNLLVYAGGSREDGSGGEALVDLTANVLIGGVVGLNLIGESGSYGGLGKLGTGAARPEGESFTSGRVDATLSSNVVAGAASAVRLEARAGGEGGRLELNGHRNQLEGRYYGIDAYAAGYEASYLPGGSIRIGLVNNEVSGAAEGGSETATSVAGQSQGVGIWLAGHAGSTIVLDATSNRISAAHALRLTATGDVSGKADDVRGEGLLGVGGVIQGYLENNLIEGLDGPGIDADAHAPFAGSGSYAGGQIDLDLSGNEVTGFRAMDLYATGSFSTYSDLGANGRISVDLDGDRLRGDANNGVGLYAYAYDAADGNARRGGEIDLVGTNCVLTGYYGAQLYARFGEDAPHSGDLDVRLTNCTILGLGDSGDEIALVVEGELPAPVYVSLVNNIIANQPGYGSFLQGGGYFLPALAAYGDAADPDVLDHNLLWNGPGEAPLSYLSGTEQYTAAEVNALPFASGNVSGPPAFEDLSDADFDLTSGSAAIGEADSKRAPAEDIRGRPRDQAPDIGAYEYQDMGGGAVVFQDVDPRSTFLPFILTLASNGITGGCSVTPPLFCPADPVTREQMAVFVVRALGEAPDRQSLQRFADVPPERPSFGHVQRFASLHITSGCTQDRFCPGGLVTREQMAVFLARATGSQPVACTGRFSDVPVGHPRCGYIERLALDGVTTGCGGGRFCPGDAVTREQMAVFLVRAFGLVPGLGGPGAVARGLLPEGALGLGADAIAAGGHERAATARRPGAGPVGDVGPVANQRLRIPEGFVAERLARVLGTGGKQAEFRAAPADGGHGREARQARREARAGRREAIRERLLALPAGERAAALRRVLAEEWPDRVRAVPEPPSAGPGRARPGTARRTQ